MSLDEWLAGLEGDGAQLWPKTPVGNLQAECWRRVGASDWNLDDPRCRAANIVGTLREMKENNLLLPSFSVLDLCCGDGVVLMQVARAFLEARCWGIDLLRYPSHRIFEGAGVRFRRVALQRLVESDPPAVVDVAVMLNTFRGWDKAGCEPLLPEKTLHWLKGNCRYAFLTVTAAQQTWLKREGWFVWDCGPGEDHSRLVCGFPCEGPDGPTGVWSWE